jgi:hypothetical protein
MRTDLALRMLLLPLVVLLGVGATAPPLNDEDCKQIIAAARALTPATLAFDRTTTLVRKGGPVNTRTQLVERWDGRKWVLVSHNGKPPTAEQRRDIEGKSQAAPVPGYHQMAALIAAVTARRTDDQGRTVLIIPQLPANSVRTDDKDISRHLGAEALLGSAGGQPYVARLTVTSHEHFKLNLMITVLNFRQSSDYAPAPDGRPRLTNQAVVSQGALLGIPGGEKSETVFAYR